MQQPATTISRTPACQACIVHEYQAGEREWAGSGIEYAASDVRRRHGWAGRTVRWDRYTEFFHAVSVQPACQREQLRCTALTEHEIDEVIGLGSRIGDNSNDLRPQDLVSWSSAGHRNITSSGTRYFSINGGVTNIVGFNQDPDGDFGDWLSGACPQAHPYVQNAFSAPDNLPTSRPHRQKALISMLSATI